MKRVLIAAVGAVLFATTAQAATITNGSFESGTNPNVGPGFLTVTAPDSTTITGWTVSAGSVDYIGNYWQAGEGNRSIDLAGVSLGTISQLILDTIAGTEYRVDFLVSKNPDGGAPTRTGTLVAGNDAFGFSYSAPNTRANMLWQNVGYTFMAEGPTVLSFAADASSGCCFGAAIDNVRIDVVPEPGAWAMMIGGFALMGSVLRRRRRTSVSGMAVTA